MRAAWLVVAAAVCLTRAGPGPPYCSFSSAQFNLSIAENSPPRTYASQPPDDEPLGVRVPLDGDRARFRIRHGDKDKFFKAEERCLGDFCFLWLRTRAGHSDVLNRERRDKYELKVRVVCGEKSEETDLVISVTDTNDLSPFFEPTEYEIVVREDAALHTVLGRVSAEDADLGANGQIYYSLGTSSEFFAVHPTSGEITVTRPLNRATTPTYELTVLARDRSALLTRRETAPAARATLKVRVTGANMHAPELTVATSSEIDVDGGVGALLTVDDRDEGEAGRVASLDIIDGDPDGHFRVRPTKQPNEWALVALPLRSESASPNPAHYELTLRAKDAGRPPRASYLSLKLEGPRAPPAETPLAHASISSSISELAPIGSPVARLAATLRDSRLSYEIVGGNEGGEFRLNPDTGILYTSTTLDAERRTLYSLTVAALDRRTSNPQTPTTHASTKVEVTVLDENDNNPVFESKRISVRVRENQAPGSIVARLRARDVDSGRNGFLSYGIANVHPLPFEVEPLTGIVRTTTRIDYETMRRHYALKVRASDWGKRRRRTKATLELEIEDVNDNRPQFERVACTVRVSKRTASGIALLTLSALDADAGDVVSYRVLAAQDPAACLSVDQTTGVLSLSCDLMSNDPVIAHVNVTATDGEHFADPTTIVLHAVAGDGAPEAECRETNAARRIEDMMAAAERDARVSDNDSNDDPDDDSEPEEAINAHTPEFIDFPVELRVNESTPVGSTITQLKTIDRDPGYEGIIWFTISSGDDEGVFELDSETGELKLATQLDREREHEYFVNVTALDCGKERRSISRLLPVTVLDDNDNVPMFDRALLSVRVPESAPNGTLICKLHAFDKDEGVFGHVTYIASAALPFCVDRYSGELRVCAALDREKTASFEVQVQAVDGGGLASFALVRIQLDDVNDEPPMFTRSQYYLRVLEDIPEGTVVGAVEGIDPDEGPGGIVRYAIESEDTPLAVDPVSGTLRLSKALDREARASYTSRVKACDAGVPSLCSEAVLVLDVLDVDENIHAPLFPARLLTAFIYENASRGSEVISCGAKDLDPPGPDSRLSYFFLSGTGVTHFSVDDAGVIRTVSLLDRETTPFYWLKVCAEDQAVVPKRSCVPVFVEVGDVNDECPWFDRAQYFANASSLSPAGISVATVHATDRDARQPLTYRIVAGNPDGLFTIDELSGEIKTTGRGVAKDADFGSSIALDVESSDGQLTSSTRVIVSLTPRNSHAPAFTQSYYRMKVTQTHREVLGDEAQRQVGSSEAEADSDADEAADETYETSDDASLKGLVTAGRVLALDGDSGAHGDVRYSWRAKGSAERSLRVGARSGRVMVAPSSSAKSLELHVRACDSAVPARCAHARVSVRFVPPPDADHNSPPKIASPQPLAVTELDSPGYLIHLLQAKDPDDDALYYDIVGGDDRFEFSLGREDGSLVLARRLRWETQANYLLNISVTDQIHVVYVQVNVSVINDVSEDGVTFTEEDYSAAISADARAGTALLQLRVTDESTRVLFGVQSARTPASLALFRLDELSGVLYLAQTLERESESVHELCVWARDWAPRASRGVARVRVAVGGVAVIAPSWPRRLLKARVWRWAAAGTLLLRVSCTCDDDVRFALVGGDAGALFALHPLSGEVRLTRSPPADSPREFTLQVRATNAGGASPLLLLHVELSEGADEPPTFVRDRFSVEMAENEPPSLLPLRLELSGGSAVRFSLLSGEGLFRVHPAIGTLHTLAPLDYERCDSYNLTIVATDMNGASASAQVHVRVLDRNEFPPKPLLRQSEGSIREDAPIGSLVLTPEGNPLVIETEDADSLAHRGRRFHVLERDARSSFAIDRTTGAVVIIATLDYEENTEYAFTVEIEDADQFPIRGSFVVSVKVKVLDVDDEPPYFTQRVFSASIPDAELTPHSRVMTLSATDKDTPPQRLRYELLQSDALRIDAAGVVRLATDGLASERLTVGVRVTDGVRTDDARLEVTRVKPASQGGLAFPKDNVFVSLPENSSRAITVLVLDVLGAALHDHVRFSILNPMDEFQIGESSGAIRTTGVVLDRESRANFTLAVQATAANERWAIAFVHIAVSDVNDNCPVWVGAPYEAHVRAGSPTGSHVIAVHAVDLDEAQPRYELKRGPGDAFRVDRSSGAISLRREAAPGEHELLLAALDGVCAVEAIVRVRVWRSDAPSWRTPRVELTVEENVEPGRRITPTFGATSPLGRMLRYSLLEANECPEFELHCDAVSPEEQLLCWLEVSDYLDYERRKAYACRVRASDPSTSAYADATLVVGLRDENDCSPSFSATEWRWQVREDARIGALVGVASATDRDSPSLSFSLEWDSPDDIPLSIDRHGQVRVASALDAEMTPKMRLRVIACDESDAPLCTKTNLFLNVSDVNDNRPRWSHDTRLSVRKRIAFGVALGAVRAIDADAEPQLKYHLVRSDSPDYHLDETTGLIIYTGEQGKASEAMLSVSASDGGHSIEGQVFVRVTNENEHSPRFTQSMYDAFIDENTQPLKPILTIQATDDDSGEWGVVRFSLEAISLKGLFRVDAESGDVFVLAPLDREDRDEWTLPVAATDAGGRRAVAIVRLRVIDRDEHSPLFALDEYRVSVVKDRAFATRPLIRVEASDKDAQHERISYSLEGEHQLFHIDPESGELSFRDNATHLNGQCLSVWVRANSSMRSSACAVHVCVVERVPPLWAPDIVRLREDAASSALLAELRPASASASAASVRFRIAKGRDESAFTIEDDGRLVLASTLDREKQSIYRIGVIAEWDATEEIDVACTTKTISVVVLDVNDNAPTFLSHEYHVDLAEDTPPHSTVAQVIAEDVDLGANGEVRYSLEQSADEADHPFAIEANSGCIVSIRAFDRELHPEYSLLVFATDAGTPPLRAEARVRVKIIDVDDEPHEFQNRKFIAEVKEDASPGSVVMHLGVNDADVRPMQRRLFIVEGDADGRFQVDAAGTLLLAKSLDREHKDEYRLRILATDGAFDAFADVLVRVKDVDDNPPYSARSRYESSLREDTAIGSVVLTVVVLDDDLAENAKVKHYLTGEDSMDFTIDKETGEVRVAKELDRERRAFYKIEVFSEARSNSEWKCSAELWIEVTDVNDNAPRFASDLYDVSISEDAELETLLVQLRATDSDIGENRRIRYQIDEGTDLFAIDEQSGSISLKGQLDRETASSHRLTVRATDSGAPRLHSVAKIAITVADVNDNPPRFERRHYEISVPEMDVPGTELLRLHALSEDTGVNAEVTYEIVNGNEDGIFILDPISGVLSLQKSLDYETAHEHSLRIQATDGGIPPLSDVSEVQVRVIDANDNAPRFLRSDLSARVREDAPLGERVIQVTAEDNDSGLNARVTYSIEAQDKENPFAVDADTGHISVAAPLDRETKDKYLLKVKARDRGLPSREAIALLHITVLDANDNAPSFSNEHYEVVVRAGRAAGVQVLTLHVEDEDIAPNAAPFTFDLQSGNEQGAFRLEEDGTLITAKILNRRVKDRYALQVRVFDNGSPPLFSDTRIDVIVAEESQYPPVVTPLEVLVISYRDRFPGGDLGTVRALDRDPLDSLGFALASPEAMFRIEPSSGRLWAEPRVDPGEFVLNVTVTDGKYTGSAPVRVIVRILTDEELAQAVVVRFRAVTDVDFVLSHRKGFIRAVAEATDRPTDSIVLIGAQLSSDESRDWENELRRRKRQVSGDLDVAFIVVEVDGRPISAEIVRRRIHANLDRIEERARLVVEELVRAPCSRCGKSGCFERLEVNERRAKAIASDVFSLVAPAMRLRAICADEEEPRTDIVRTQQASVRFSGDGYLEVAVDAGVGVGALSRPLQDALTLQLRYKSRATDGTLLWASGPVDFLVLELRAGSLRLEMQLGAGVATASLPAPPDAEWHSVRLERRGGWARLQLDRRTTHLHATPDAASLDLAEHRFFIGARVESHKHADAPLEAGRGFIGCISGLQAWGVDVPLREGDSQMSKQMAEGDGVRLRLLRREKTRDSDACTTLPVPSLCHSYPCLNGGTCSETENGTRSVCSCHERFSGAFCELDLNPCLGKPCLHGGTCVSVSAGAFHCVCPSDTRGLRCEGRFCVSAPCGHGGACEEGVEGAVCRCRGYFGASCQFDVDECAGEPCLNGATCLNEPGSFRCLCPPDKTGMNCGDPLYSDAVTLDVTSSSQVFRHVWRWLSAAGWVPWAVAAGAVALLLLGAASASLCLRRTPPPPPSPPRAAKLSNLEPPARALNNADTLRSYGSAGDELEGVPRDYRRNLNLEPHDRKPWSEQMHLHTFSDNKIYNDLKGDMAWRGAGVYHWDCSDWCGAAPVALQEVGALSERPDSDSPTLKAKTNSSNNDSDDYRGRVSALVVPRLREPDAASLITMLEERRSLLTRSASDLSTRLCEIEDSEEDGDNHQEEEEEEDEEPSDSSSTLTGPRHTDV